MTTVAEKIIDGINARARHPCSFFMRVDVNWDGTADVFFVDNVGEETPVNARNDQENNSNDNETMDK